MGKPADAGYRCGATPRGRWKRQELRNLGPMRSSSRTCSSHARLIQKSCKTESRWSAFCDPINRINRPIYIIDRVGRRVLLLFGTFMLCSCHIINAAVIGTSYTDWAAHSSSARAGTAFMFIFMFCFEVSWGPIAWGLPSEILPSIIHAEGMAMSAASNWLNNFIVGVIVPSLVADAPYGSFALFACTSFLALVWVFFCVPETRGRSLEGLGLVHNNNNNKDDAESSRKDDEVITQMLRELVQEGREMGEGAEEIQEMPGVGSSKEA